MSDEGRGILAEKIARKAAAEIAAAWPGSVVAPSGCAPADVLLVKGEASEGDLATGLALGGQDGEAARKALSALGWSAEPFAVCTRPGDMTLAAASLVSLIEAVDPDLIVAVDRIASIDVATALGIEQLEFGTVLRVAGRSVLAIDGLEASLSDEDRKRRVWSQLKGIQRG